MESEKVPRWKTENPDWIYPSWFNHENYLYTIAKKIKKSTVQK